MSKENTSAMTKQDVEVIVAYMAHLNRQMQVVMNASMLAGLAITNDFKMRGEIKKMAKAYEHNQARLEIELQQIVDPENAPDLDKAGAMFGSKNKKSVDN